jgi:hypothetical protein
MDFTKVVTVDWNGKLGTYKVLALIVRGDINKYSCTFINSTGDTEKQLVEENQLHCD